MSVPARWRDRIYESIGLKEWKYDRLDQTDNPDLSQPNPRQDPSASSSSSSWPRNKVIKVGAAAFAVFVFLVLIFRPSPKQITSLIYDQEARSAYFYLVLPAATSNTDFCKTVFSAAVLDYPTPRILNWDETFDDAKLPHGGRDLAKVLAIHELLEELGSHTDEDLMLIADGYDTWFQLRPSVVIDRYYAINDRANKRIAKQLGRSKANQSIVFSAQKRCSSDNPDSVECSSIPESDLPADIYGSNTDKDKGDGFGSNRQRYLNAGTIIGPIGELRKLFKAAVEYADDGDFKSDTDVLARLYGEQEHHRQKGRRALMRSRSLWRRWFTSDDDAPLASRKDKSTDDYGIGLDYYGEISQPAEYDEGDTAWVLHNSTDKFRKLARRSDVPIEIPSEVAHSTPPFWTPDYTGYVQAPAAYDWSQVPLFTNLWTGVAPAAIRLSPGSDNYKAQNPLVEKTWDQAWFLPYLRSMLVAKARAPRMPHAVVRREDSGMIEEWWGPDDNRGGIRIETGDLPGDWKSWTAVCGSQDVADEVLADGHGPWANPGWLLDHDGGRAQGQLKDWFKQWWAAQNGSAVWGEKLP